MSSDPTFDLTGRNALGAVERPEDRLHVDVVLYVRDRMADHEDISVGPARPPFGREIENDVGRQIARILDAEKRDIRLRGALDVQDFDDAQRPARGCRALPRHGIHRQSDPAIAPRDPAGLADAPSDAPHRQALSRR